MSRLQSFFLFNPDNPTGAGFSFHVTHPPASKDVGAPLSLTFSSPSLKGQEREHHFSHSHIEMDRQMIIGLSSCWIHSTLRQSMSVHPCHASPSMMSCYQRHSYKSCGWISVWPRQQCESLYMNERALRETERLLIVISDLA